MDWGLARYPIWITSASPAARMLRTAIKAALWDTGSCCGIDGNDRDIREPRHIGKKLGEAAADEIQNNFRRRRVRLDETS